MPPPYPNRLSGQFHDEIDEANERALANDYEGGLGPFIAQHWMTGSTHNWEATRGFTYMVSNSTLIRKFKWTLNTRLDLAVVNPELKHAVGSGGGEVWTAGHGWFSGPVDGKAGEVTLNNDTGHYWTSEKSLLLAVQAWEALNYRVRTQAFVDPKAALAKLF
ncbi:MAG TPA: hypothetical protein VF861_14645 [Telluria sp.]